MDYLRTVCTQNKTLFLSNFNINFAGQGSGITDREPLLEAKVGSGAQGRPEVSRAALTS